MIVRSAAKLVSNTASKPTRLSAAASRSSITRTPSLLLWPSSRVAGTAGATCATTTASGSASARDDVVHLVALDDRARRAHAGALAAVDALAHVEADGEAGRDLRVLNPRPVKSIAPTPCTSWQAVTQRPQSTHLLGSRQSAGELMSTGCCLTAPT